MELNNKHFVLRVVLLLITFLRTSKASDEFVKYDPPRITAGVPATGSDLITTRNTNFKLHCESKEPITWSYPLLNDIESRLKIQSYDNPGKEYSYSSDLIVDRSDYLDTGYYYCLINGTENTNQVEKTGKIYVYVYDPNHLFATVSDYSIMTATQYDSVVLPCRPTHPNINVSLSRDSIEVDLTSKDIFLEYNPKIGFLISNALINQHAGLYECKGFDFNIPQKTSEILIHLEVLTPANNIPPKPQINDSLATPVALGGNFTLECSILMDLGVVFELQWKLPNATAFQNGHAIQGPTSSAPAFIKNIEYRFAKVNLYVYNVTDEDEGYYTCVIVNHGQKENNETRFIEVIDNDTNYLRIYVNGNKNITSNAGAPHVQWVVMIEAYPSPELQWFLPSGQEAQIGPTKTKYEMTSNNRQTILKINDIIMNDAGKYELRASTKLLQQSLDLFLTVFDRPAVHIEGLSEYYMYNQYYTINCIVLAYPLPQLTWYFRNCTDYHECEGRYEVLEDNPNTTQCRESSAQCVQSSIRVHATDTVHLKCHAVNDRGEDSDSMLFLITDIKNGFSLEGPTNTIEGDDVILLCGASVYNYTGDIQWYRYQTAGQMTSLPGDSRMTVLDTSTKFTYQQSLLIPHITVNDTGNYVCRVPKIELPGEFGETELPVHVKAVVPTEALPGNNMDDSKVSVKVGDSVEFSCTVKGVPEPEMKWFKDNFPFVMAPNTTRMEFRNNLQSLFIKFANVEDNGIYTCKARNRGGEITRSAELHIQEPVLQEAFLIPGIVIGSIVLLIFVCLLVYFTTTIRKEKRRHRELTMHLEAFEKGNVECINQDLPVDDQAELLPYDRKWEFPRDKLHLGKQVGCGAFGRVVKADADGILPGQKSTTVAVKMVKSGADLVYILALLSELKIMIHLGRNLNVLNLLGACTDNVKKNKVLVIVEYCRFGNLQNYLLRHREEFINQIDPNTGYVDPKIGADKLQGYTDTMRKKEREAARKLNYSKLEFSGGDYRISTLSNTSSDVNRGGQSTDSTYAPVNVSMSPTGCPDEFTFDSNSSNSSGQTQPVWRNNYRGDYHRAEVRPISSSDLMCWSYQIARGMDYLTSRKVLHRDLAARNILLAEDNVVKICDFGLAKDVYKKDIYKKKGEGLLPAKWMAIESIQDQVFSTQSDIWSFGIVLWELFSLGKTPYPGMDADEKFFQKIVEGYRMDKPNYATDDIYKLMWDCWKADPNTRPSFAQLAAGLDTMLEDNVKEHYLSLNRPYVKQNEEMQQHNPDYLGMMAKPEYSNIVNQSTPERDHMDHCYINTPQVGSDGYLLMSPKDPSESAVVPLTDGSGYLFMKSPESIFSPTRPNQDSVFDFERKRRTTAPDADLEAALPSELKPMLSESSDSNWAPRIVGAQSNDSGIASPTNANSFFNPSYQFFPIEPASTNCGNMPTILESLEESNKERQDSGKGSDISNESDNVFSLQDAKYLHPGKHYASSQLPNYNTVLVNGD